MIVIRVELHSAVTKKITELARMHICNVGVSIPDGGKYGDYTVETFRGRNKKALDKLIVTRKGVVSNYPRLALHIWHLVYEALKSLKYNRRPNHDTD